MFLLVVSRRLAAVTRRSRVHNNGGNPVGSGSNVAKDRSPSYNVSQSDAQWVDVSTSASAQIAELDSVTERIIGRNKDQSVARLQAVVDAMELADQARARVPLRDLAAQVLPFLSKGEVRPETLSLVVRGLRSAGRGMVYFQELFEFLVSHRSSLTPADLSVVIYECGRHGLRSKHYLDTLVKEVPAQVSSMDRESLSRTLKGICKFAGDYSSTAQALVKRTSFSTLSSEEVSVLLRILRQTGDADSFTQLVRKTDFTSFSLVQKFGAIYLLKRSRNFSLDSQQRRVAAAVTESLVTALSETPMSELSSAVITTDLTDCLDALASWKVRDEVFLAKIMAVLTERVAEIKYSPICGLWQSVTDSLGHLSYFEPKWMRVVDELASSEFNLRAFAAFQLVFFTSSLGRLNYYSEAILKAIIAVVAPDVASINDADMLATLMFPLDRAAFECPDLVEAVLGQTARIATRPTQATSRGQFRGVLTAAYSCASLGAGPEDPRFAKIAEFLFNQKSYTFMNPQDYIRLCRLEALGFFHRVPEQLRSSRDFASWSRSETRNRRIAEYLAAGATRVDNIPFVDVRLADGTLVIIPDAEEPMRHWAHPGDTRNYELVPLDRNGTRSLVSRFLTNRDQKFIFSTPV